MSEIINMSLFSSLRRTTLRLKMLTYLCLDFIHLKENTLRMKLMSQRT